MCVTVLGYQRNITFNNQYGKLYILQNVCRVYDENMTFTNQVYPLNQKVNSEIQYINDFDETWDNKLRRDIKINYF